jgi:Lrp/AsnC family leucine-responsive transcriptional regulator
MVEKLDLKDKKILYELDLDSRQSFGSVAKKVGLSKNSVINRVNGLVERGIIKNFKTIIDFGKIGYLLVNFCFDLKSASPKIEQEFIDFLCKKKIVYRVSSMDGKFNLRVQIISKSMSEVYSLWEDIFKKYVNYIKERQLMLVTRNYYYYRPYLIENSTNSLELAITSHGKFETLDRVDMELLRILTRGARTSILNLAEKVKITPKTVISRIKSLRRRKIIVGYGLSLDLEKIGYQVFKVSFILTRLTPKRISEFQNYIRNHPNIIYDEEVVGGDDYEIEIQVKNVADLREIIKDIQLNFSDILDDYHILHVFKNYKGLTFPENI